MKVKTFLSIFHGTGSIYCLCLDKNENTLCLKVDDTAVKKKLPGRFFELNIHFGVFLGGQGDFSELFLGHMENFRGCMEDVSQQCEFLI